MGRVGERQNSEVIEQFKNLCESWGASQGHVQKFTELAYVWYPSRQTVQTPKPIGLTLGAVIHGDEVAGMDVLIETLHLLRTGLLSSPFPLAFFLGNPSATKSNRRFLLKDLNRSFGQTSVSHDEEERARQLEPLLKQSALFVDFHQTIEPSQTAFFIFPYMPSSFYMAQALHQQLPIVTHWGLSFSKDGMCSDEFVNSQGGTALTVELGQKGFGAYYTGVGLQVVLAAIQYGMKLFSDSKVEPLRNSNEIYTWNAIVPYQEGMKLREGLANFQPINADEVVGTLHGKPLNAVSDGWILFPKYSRDPDAPPPKELYRIMKKIHLSELGQNGVINR